MSEKRTFTPEDFAINPDTYKKVLLRRDVRLFVQNDDTKVGIVPGYMSPGKPTIMGAGTTVLLGAAENRYYDHQMLIAYPVIRDSDGKTYFILDRELVGSL